MMAQSKIGNYYDCNRRRVDYVGFAGFEKPIMMELDTKCALQVTELIGNVIALDKKRGYFSKNIRSQYVKLDFLIRDYELLCFTNKGGRKNWIELLKYVQYLLKENNNIGLIVYVKYGDVLLFPKASYINSQWIKIIVEKKWSGKKVEAIFSGTKAVVI